MALQSSQSVRCVLVKVKRSTLSQFSVFERKLASASLRETILARKVICSLIFIVAAAARVASLFGLPLGLLSAFDYGALLLLSGSRLPAPPDASGWYVVAAAFMIFPLSLVPRWRHRDPPL